ncbi:MAG: stage II sporulation protein M [Oscillospiraceae bacterium]
MKNINMRNMKNMRIKNIKTQKLIFSVKTHVRNNRNQYILTCISLIMGLVVGVVSALILRDGNAETLNSYINNFFSAYSLQGVSRTEVFKLSLIGNLKTAAVLWTCGLTPYLIPLSLIHVGANGVGIGFSVSFILKEFMLKGVLFSLVSLLPHNLIALPSIIVYTVFNINFAIEFKKHKLDNTLQKVKRNLIIKNLTALGIFIGMLTISSLIEGYIIPTFIRPLCGMFIK